MGFAAIIFDGYLTSQEYTGEKSYPLAPEKIQAKAEELGKKMGMKLPIRVFSSSESFAKPLGTNNILLNEKQFEEKDDLSFLLAHEISHLKNRDHINSFLVSTVVSVSVGFLALPFFSFIFIEGACSLLFVITKIFYIRLSENNADEEAIKVTSWEEKKAQIKIMDRMLASNLLYRLQENVSFFESIKRKIEVDAEGNNRFDVTHLSLSSRIRKIQSHLLKSNFS